MASIEASLRRKKILEILSQDGMVRVAELARAFGVSAVTVRADLAALERQGLLVRTRGGALPASPGRIELPLRESRKVHLKEKAKIGRFAASLIRDGETVIVDVGSTTTELARALPRGLRRVLIVTNALNIALMLEDHPGISVIVTGGTLRSLQHSLVNPFGTLVLDEIHADKAFIGCNGVHPRRGVTNVNVQEAEIKKKMIAQAASVYVLADHTKLMRITTAKIAPLSAVDALITDDAAESAAVSALEHAGLRVHLASGSTMANR